MHSRSGTSTSSPGLQDTFPEGNEASSGPAAEQPVRPRWDRTRLLNLIDRSPSLMTVVDEAYLPFLPDEGEANPDQRDQHPRQPDRAAFDDQDLRLPRRIGYAVASPDIVAMLRRSQQPWTVTTAAEVAAIAAVDDTDYLQPAPWS